MKVSKSVGGCSACWFRASGSTFKVLGISEIRAIRGSPSNGESANQRKSTLINLNQPKKMFLKEIGVVKWVIH